MVVEGKRRSCNCGGNGGSSSKIRLWRENEMNGGNNQFCRRQRGQLDASRAFVSSGVPDRTSGSQRWPGLIHKSGGKRGGGGTAGRITPSGEKMATGGLIGETETAGDGSNPKLQWHIKRSEMHGNTALVVPNHPAAKYQSISNLCLAPRLTMFCFLGERCC
jgi:hypothetical protein